MEPEGTVPWGTILGHLHPLLIPTTCLPKVHLNVSFPLHSFTRGFPTKILLVCLILVTCPAHHSLLQFTVLRLNLLALSFLGSGYFLERSVFKHLKHWSTGRPIWRPATGHRIPKPTEKDPRQCVWGTSTGWTFKKGWRTQLECNNSIGDRGLKEQLCLRRKKTLYEAIRQMPELEIAKLIVGSSVRLQRMSVWAQWRSRPPPKRKKRLQTI
jgi:hypothetical protein